ncbi:T9SS type A sorting domain-containing protein [Chryseobacterium sp. JUb7]|uniref:T9SS type A sorting domain-containing protein n=1 Tax=Chryseobacterium sp. JUb7 TaxID=2940599 RepID=UPI002169FA20|nr:T9SS type A sorting domain-containing protein [Chryseobacterium sp. JUb7]
MYPNPSSDYIKVSEKMETLIVYDAVGREVLRAKDTDTVDLRSLISGNYILKLYSKEISNSYKIIKK